MRKPKINTEYWENNTPEKKIKPFYLLGLILMTNITYFIFTQNTLWTIINCVAFTLGSLLPIVSYNKWKKEASKDGNKGTRKEVTS